MKTTTISVSVECNAAMASGVDAWANKIRRERERGEEGEREAN